MNTNERNVAFYQVSRPVVVEERRAMAAAVGSVASAAVPNETIVAAGEAANAARLLC